MKIIYILLIAAFLMMVQSSFASKVCLKDNLGFWYELTGGRVDKKTYTVKRFRPGCCVISGYADVTLDSFGVYTIAIYSGHSPSVGMSPLMLSANGDELFNSTGNYDVFVDGVIDGTVIFTNLPCSSLPPENLAPLEEQYNQISASTEKE